MGTEVTSINLQLEIIELEKLAFETELIVS